MALPVYACIVSSSAPLFPMKKLLFAILAFLASVPVLGQAPPPGTSRGIRTFNGTLEADQFSGVDMCAKIAAAVSALPAGGGNVDATHFTGDQRCATDFTATAKPVNITFGQVLIQTSVPFVPGNAALALIGAGPQFSGIEYTSSTSIPAIITYSPAAPLTHEFNGVHVSGLRIYAGKGSKVTDGLLIEGVHRSHFENLSFWGMTGCGFHTKYAVTDTFYRIHTSGQDANVFGMAGGSTPAHDLCWDELDSAHFTTDGTATDFIAEGLTGAGIYVKAATTMVATAGTSESNVGGIEIDSPSQANTFIGSDLEANSSYDVQDAGNYSVYLNILSSSLVHIASPSRNSSILGGELNALTIDSGVAAFYYNTATGDNGGVVRNNGAGTNNLAASGYGVMSPPGAGADTFNVDQNIISGPWYFEDSSTTTIHEGNPIHPSVGATWKALFIGRWTANAGNSGDLPVPVVLEASSTSPAINAFGLNLTFSLNSTGYLQVVNNASANFDSFNGTIYLLNMSGIGNIDKEAESLLGNVRTSGGFQAGGGYLIPSTNQPAEYVGTLTLTAATSDSLTVKGIPVGAHCSGQPSDATATAATNIYIPPVATAGTVVVDHTATLGSGGTLSIFCAFE